MNEPSLPQNIVAELLSLLGRTIAVIEKQSEALTGQSDFVIASETKKLKDSQSALASAVASQPK